MLTYADVCSAQRRTGDIRVPEDEVCERREGEGEGEREREREREVETAEAVCLNRVLIEFS